MKLDLEYASGERIIEIRDKEYTCNVYDLKAVRALQDFSKQVQEVQDIFNDEFLSMCRTTIDTVLGKGSSKSIFKTTEKSTLPYYLCNKLYDIYIEELGREKKEKEKAAADHEIDMMRRYNEQMRAFYETMKMAGDKYDLEQKGPAEKH